MIELEKTYLAKFLPNNLAGCEQKELLDVYIPMSSCHPKIRLRKRGEILEITKKTLVDNNDVSQQNEQTIDLTKDEFEELLKVGGKKVRKIRHYFKYKGREVEIDVFKDDLFGLVLVDVEFDSIEEKNKFQIPDFCLVEVTQEDFLAGGMLCGKSYQDIEENLVKFDYRKIQ